MVSNRKKTALLSSAQIATMKTFQREQLAKFARENSPNVFREVIWRKYVEYENRRYVEYENRGMLVQSSNAFPDSRGPFFSPEWYLREGFITLEIVDNLRNGAKAVSFGSGPGHLCTFLVRAFGVPKKNIVVSDRLEYEEHAMVGFQSIRLDFTKELPNLPPIFDYVFFPHSIYSAVMDDSAIVMDDILSVYHMHMLYEKKRGILKEIINSSTSRAFEIGKKLLSPVDGKPYMGRLANAMRGALSMLKTSGEIRMDGTVISDAHLAYMKYVLSSENAKQVDICVSDELVEIKVEKTAQHP